jgi:hypothetical protein
VIAASHETGTVDMEKEKEKEENNHRQNAPRVQKRPPTILTVCSPPSGVHVAGCSALFHPLDAPDLPWDAPSWDACEPPATLYSFDESDPKRFLVGKCDEDTWVHFTDGEWHADRGAVFGLGDALVLSSPAYPLPGGRHRIEDRMQLTVVLNEDFDAPHGGAIRLDARVERCPFRPDTTKDTGSDGSDAAETQPPPSRPDPPSAPPCCSSHDAATPPQPQPPGVSDMAPTLQDMRLSFSEVGLICLGEGLYVSHAITDDAHYALYEVMWDSFSEEEEAAVHESKGVGADDGARADAQRSEAFAVAKFLCRREGPSSDVALTLDSANSEAVWYIDGREVHRRGNLGLIPPLGPGETLMYRLEGRQRRHAVCPESIRVVLGNARMLDAVPVDMGADAGVGVSTTASGRDTEGGGAGAENGGNGKALVRLPGDNIYASVSGDPSRPPEFRWDADGVSSDDIATWASCFSLTAMTVRSVPVRWAGARKYAMLRTMSTVGWRDGVNGAFVPFASHRALRGHVALSERAKEEMGLANGDMVGVFWFGFPAAGVDEPSSRAS